MHIKLLTIEGFKTYKQQTIIEPFSPRHNVVLGKNGSGKSNIFDAIQFVLSDKFSTLRTEERQGLLHEGSGRDVMTASVEIVFDNTDMRFPIEKDEISLKRTIGLKKDEYFLDNKHVSKTEVVSLLESAGLSRSNPYYIVQQGQVRRLIQMKNSERLELLKEIAGTRTYDERRKESLKIMGDTDKRRSQIEEVITYIEKRLAELEEEKQELKQYQELDTERRCLEYTIYDQEMKEAVEKLDQIEDIRENSSEKTNKFHAAVADATKKREEAEVSLKALTAEIASEAAKKKGLSKQLKDAIKLRATCELQVKEAKGTVESEKSSKADAAKELKELTAEVKTKQKSLDAAIKDYEKKVEEEEKTKGRIAKLDQRVSELYSKQGRKSQFKTKKDRDEFLVNQIKDLKKDLASEKSQLDKLNTEITKSTKTLEAKQAEVEARAKEMEAAKGSIDKTNEAYKKLKEERNDATNARKELWRDESGLDGEVKECETKLKQAEKSLQYAMDKMMYKGLETVKEIVADLKITGYHGPLIDLFEVDEKFQKCVETTAGNSLFNIVVDTDTIASKIIKELNKRNAGRVTFIPLNQLSGKETTYPKSMEVIPMIEKIQFDNKYKKAMLQVFGKTLVTRDIKVASTFARQHNFNTITLAGDQVNKKGALTGGYIDQKKSRLEIRSEIKLLQEKYNQISSKSETIKKSIEEKETRVTTAMAEIEKHNANRTHLRNLYSQQQLDHKAASKEVNLLQDAITRNSKVVKTLESALEKLQSQIDALESEKGAEFAESLSKEDQKELHDNTTELATLKETYILLTTSRSSAETKKRMLQDLLTSNLEKRKEELETVTHSQAAEEASDKLERETVNLQSVSEKLQSLNDQMEAIDNALQTATDNKNKTLVDTEKLKNEEAKALDILTKESKSFEKLLNKRSLYVQKQEDCIKKIRDLGSLPQEAFQKKYKSIKQNELMKRLEKVTLKLKDYTHVNKKAIDQYVSFTDQRGDLISRKKELDTGREAIMELIEHLDQKKHEAIERTFKGIAKHFSTVFSELVPNGKGSLVIQTRKNGDAEEKDDDNNSGDEDDEKNSKDSVTRQYSGVGIKVSFTGSKGSDMGMMQLSGGQQCVVALSLIFAIQRCDPSPFYLFDEIDSNLDAVHRTSVTRMIHSQAPTTQFITTTFRPEMIATADKFYGVTFTNKTSLVSVLDREEAKELILVVEKENEEYNNKEASK